MDIAQQIASRLVWDSLVQGMSEFAREAIVQKQLDWYQAEKIRFDIEMALGRFMGARVVFGRSMQTFDRWFPVAYDNLCLLYDQGDLGQLHDYTAMLISRNRGCTTRWRFAPAQVCVLHLMHDIAATRRGSRAALVTTAQDLASANINASGLAYTEIEQVSGNPPNMSSSRTDLS